MIKSWVFQHSRQSLLNNILPTYCQKLGYKNMTSGDNFLYLPGSLPIMMVGHVDTVHKDLPNHIFTDPDKRILWSPEGLGGDDRAGIAGILELLDRGHRPYLLFTDLEETGLIGASNACKAMGAPPVRYMIELDRRGRKDCVFYDCANKEFEQYIESYGFVTAHGTSSDISVLGSTWKIAAVNLSIGYFEPHTKGEYLDLNIWNRTINQTEQMLRSLDTRNFGYIPKPRIPYAHTSIKPVDCYTRKETQNINLWLSSTMFADHYDGNADLWDIFLKENSKHLKANLQDLVLQETINQYEKWVLTHTHLLS